jgi:hypothetical protein
MILAKATAPSGGELLLCQRDQEYAIRVGTDELSGHAPSFERRLADSGFSVEARNARARGAQGVRQVRFVAQLLPPAPPKSTAIRFFPRP